MVVACEVCGECMSLSLVSPACLYLCLCLQDRMPVTGQPEKLLDLLGSDLLGLPVKVGAGSGRGARVCCCGRDGGVGCVL